MKDFSLMKVLYPFQNLLHVIRHFNLRDELVFNNLLEEFSSSNELHDEYHLRRGLKEVL